MKDLLMVEPIHWALELEVARIPGWLNPRAPQSQSQTEWRAQLTGLIESGGVSGCVFPCMPSCTLDLRPGSGKLRSQHGKELWSWDQVHLVLPLPSSVTLDKFLSGHILRWDSDCKRQVLKDQRCGIQNRVLILVHDLVCMTMITSCHPLRLVFTSVLLVEINERNQV